MDVQSGYRDFEVEIDELRAGTYPIHVIRSPDGERRATMPPPFSDEQLPSFLDEVRQLLGTPGYAIGNAQHKQAARAREIGESLFKALFATEVSPAFYKSKAKLDTDGQSMRLKLRIVPSELKVLPWELLFDPELNDHMLLHEHLSLVRYLEQPGNASLSVDGAVRILAVVVDLPQNPSPDARREQEHLTNALVDLEAAGSVVLTWLTNPSWRDLETAFASGDYHVFHFIGHAGYDDTAGTGYLEIASDEANPSDTPVPVELSTADLVSVIAESGTVRLAVLTACNTDRRDVTTTSTSTAEQLIAGGVPAVIAMQHLITGDAAQEFSRQLYTQIAHMRPLDRAVAAARKAIDLATAHTLEWAIPTLHMRSPNGVIFERPASLEPAVRVRELLDEARQNFHSRQWVRALEVLAQAQAVRPDDVEPRLWRALVLAETKPDTDWSADIKGALPGLNINIADRPNDQQLVGLRGMCLVAQQRYDEALADLDQAITAEFDHGGIRWARARCHSALGNTEQAIADLDKLVALLPDSAYPLATRAALHAASGSHRQAIDDLTAALLIQPSGPYRSDRAASYEAEQDYAKAAEDLGFELEQRPTAELLLQRASLHVKQEFRASGSRNFWPAIEDLSAALVLAPGRLVLFVARGDARYQQAGEAQGDEAASVADLAADDYREAAAVDTKNAALHYSLGLALERADQRSAARSAYQTALRLGDRRAKDKVPFWARWRLRP